MLTNEKVKIILNGLDKEDWEDSEVKVDGVKYGLMETENEGWKSHGKYETNTYIFEIVSGDNYDPTGVFVRQGQTRSGSYYSDYYYDYEDYEVVEQIEKTIVVKRWVKKEI